MALPRAVSAIALLAFLLTPSRPAGAGSLDACAQRVIRDWYSGGRVDRVYPLACYRAAIRALPEDVLQYSNADRDIARALAYARRGRVEDAAPRAPQDVAAPKDDPAEPDSSRPAARDEGSPPATSPRRTAVAPPPPASPANRRHDPSARFATDAQTEAVSASFPYPVIVLAVLSGVLFLTGGVGWLAARRR